MIFRNLKGWIAEKENNLWVNLFLMVLSAAIINEAFELEVGTPGNPGSGFMFFGTAALLGLLSLHQFLKSFRLRKPPSESTDERIRWGRIVAVIVANLLYIYLLKPVGYLICTFIFLCFLFQILEKGRWVSRMLGSALTSFLTYLLFVRLLSLNLPKGWISFF